ALPPDSSDTTSVTAKTVTLATAIQSTRRVRARRSRIQAAGMAPPIASASASDLTCGRSKTKTTHGATTLTSRVRARASRPARSVPEPGRVSAGPGGCWDVPPGLSPVRIVIVSCWPGGAVEEVRQLLAIVSEIQLGLPGEPGRDRVDG